MISRLCIRSHFTAKLIECRARQRISLYMKKVIPQVLHHACEKFAALLASMIGHAVSSWGFNREIVILPNGKRLLDEISASTTCHTCRKLKVASLSRCSLVRGKEKDHRGTSALEIHEISSPQIFSRSFAEGKLSRDTKRIKIDREEYPRESKRLKWIRWARVGE